MIRINLLAAERDRAKKKSVTLGTVGQKLTIGCSLILVLGGLAIGWRYWTVNHDSAELDKEIAAAQQETTRLHSVIEQVQQFEQRRRSCSSASC
jgi:Tfp pilus assembly protein PilN